MLSITKKVSMKTLKLLGKRNRRNLLHTLLLIRSTQTLATFTTLIFRRTFVGTRQGDSGNRELSTKYAIPHPQYDFSKVQERVVGRMYNISPREGERYFLRTLLLHKSGANSFANMRFHDGVQFPTFRDTCCALGLLSDGAEWLRCMQDVFSSNFDRLTELFSIIMAFCEPSNPLRIWERTKNLMITIFGEGILEWS